MLEKFYFTNLFNKTYFTHNENLAFEYIKTDLRSINSIFLLLLLLRKSERKV